MDEEDGRLGPLPGHIIGTGSYFARYGTRQRDGFQEPRKLKLLMDVTGGTARQLGRCDVLTDASTMSLRHSRALLQTSIVLSLFSRAGSVVSGRLNQVSYQGELQ